MEEQVMDTFATYKARYGAPRITRELNALGTPCSVNYVANILKHNGTRARNGKAFKYTPRTEAMTGVADNLLKRRFNADGPNQKWSTDITYIWVRDRYQAQMERHGCSPSMSRKGNCWGNAVMESFFSRLKVELIYAEQYRTVEEAKSRIFEYVEVFYNRIRRHSALGYVSPAEYERKCV
ncbi:IS3 family transposase [Marinobacterium lacunae]|nr:IS3 family transposase [Marinobacterium lacunae]